MKNDLTCMNSYFFIPDFFRVDLIQEDSEGAQTADALTNDGRKTDEVVILVETEEIPVIVPEAIEDETIASEKKAGVTGAGDAIEDPTVEGIRDQLENPKTSRKGRSHCRKQPMLTRVGKTVESKKRNRQMLRRKKRKLKKIGRTKIT